MLDQLKRARLTLRRPSQVEQRASPRRKVLLAAKVAVGVATADCTIRDISESGAQVHAPSVLRLPDEVHLLIMCEGLVIRARRAWARFPLCGLKFISAEQIETSQHPQAAPLREAWKDWMRSPASERQPAAAPGKSGPR
ncbi:MAG TPA: PilZ domain-containing protein [Caulobacteraceae bacterium]|nr:PilZ domain-containing protein [Caulobacteraceae bacterium]